MSEVNVKTKTMLWGKSAAKCSICKLDLVMDSTQTDDESLIGEVCHIYAHNNGSRSNPDLTEEQKNKYSNLVLLCRNHHKQVDDQEKEYTVEKLIEIKRQHEMWVAQSLSGEQKLRQRNLEVYADYIDKWRQYFLVDEWKRWTSFLLQPTPLFYKKDFESIKKGKEWLFTRIWSSEIPQLEDCFKNFFRISRDLMIVFGEFVDSETLEDSLRVKPFYETGNFTQQEYDELLNKFEFHVDFIFDLVAELTRAANLVSDMIRAHIDPSFMLEGGRLVIQQGLNMNLQYVSHIPLYEKEDLENLYIGIKSFSDARFDRDFYRGLQKHRNFSELSYVAMDKND